MASINASTKRVAIDKANAQMIAALAVASFVSIFCLFAAKALWSQNAYLSRVTKAKEKANTQLQANVKAYDSLVSSYKDFVGKPTNVLGGNSSGAGDNDGDNAKIVLDALPSAYDFPALLSSVEKILNDGHYHATNITGSDDELGQQANAQSDSPQPVQMPFTFTVDQASAQSAQELTATLERSIRPIQIGSMVLSGGGNNMSVTITANTYYQPAKNLNIKKEVVK